MGGSDWSHCAGDVIVVFWSFVSSDILLIVLSVRLDSFKKRNKDVSIADSTGLLHWVRCATSNNVRSPKNTTPVNELI